MEIKQGLKRTWSEKDLEIHIFLKAMYFFNDDAVADIEPDLLECEVKWAF